jgi:hypothetical protein
MTDRQQIEMASDLRVIAIAIEGRGSWVCAVTEHRFRGDATAQVERVRKLADRLGVRLEAKREGYSVWARVMAEDTWWA